MLIHGSKEGTSELADYCRIEGVTDEVYTPSIGECVDVASATNLFQVNIIS
jgi:hypothetical protein